MYNYSLLVGNGISAAMEGIFRSASASLICGANHNWARTFILYYQQAYNGDSWTKIFGESQMITFKLVLRTTTLALVYSAAEYCAPVWCRSAHTRLIDKPINDALRIVTGCLRPTPTDNLYVLEGIQPSELRRK